MTDCAQKAIGFMSIFQCIYPPYWMIQWCNTIDFMSIFQCIYALWWMLQWCNIIGFMSIFQWIYAPWWMLQWCNTIGFMPIFQCMYAPWWMLQWCNSVRVVLLTALGWRRMSLPWVHVRKEIQRHRCWAFSVKARLQWNLLWRINQKKRNTYGVVPRTTYVNPG